ncbi:MAG: aldo/keto reductase [Rhizobiales bacterium]|nr:aldo/keto reductase [Hyphomicrobiales bacterium]
MRYRQLGRTGLEVSEVGFGGAGVGHVWGETSDSECERAIRRAVDLGINFFDTSPMYGGGKSEENLGAGLAGLRDKVVLATKVRLHSEDELANLKSAIRSSVEQSLARLRTERIDVLQIHHQVGPERGQYLAVASPPRYALLLTEADCLAFAEAAQGLIDDGTVGFLGITAWDGDGKVVRALLESGAFATAQVLYNLVNHSAEAPPPPGFDDVDQGQALVAARDNNIGVIGIRSHAAGALVETLDREVAADSDVARDHARAGRLSFLLSETMPTLSAVALRFCLDNPAISTVTPGIKKTAEVEEAVRVADLPPLSIEDRNKISALYQNQFSG